MSELHSTNLDTDVIVSELESKLEYAFNDPELLIEAVTHSSFGWIDENEVRIDNEKLEFIGDGFLDAVIGAQVYRRMPTDAKEGDLTKTRAQIVCESSLARVGREFSLGRYLRLGVGEEKTGGREKDSLIADSVEAIIGAIYIDGGYDSSCRFVLKAFEALIGDALNGKLITDYKTELQEMVHRAGGRIKYIVDYTEGPDHDKTFHVNLEINDEIISKGVGKSKKEAQQNAAQLLFEKGLEDVL